MGPHYSKVDAALSGKIDPTTLQYVCITHFPPREGLRYSSKPDIKSSVDYCINDDCLLEKKASYKGVNMTRNLTR